MACNLYHVKSTMFAERVFVYKKPNGFNSLSVSMRFVVSFTAFLALTACQGKGSIFNFKAFKERATETPVPDVLNVEKSFFLSTDGKPKYFMCGWAPEVEAGEYGEWLFGHLDHASPHCNLVFEIKDQNWLVGRLVNPTFMQKPKKGKGADSEIQHWKEYVRIPIVSHFYYERAKDQHGRETNEWVENSTRSDFSARPMIKLNLAGIQLVDPGLFWSKSMNDGLSHSTATDIEWDKQRGFLGFTLNMSLSTGSRISAANAQAHVRVNFLRFEHDPHFQKTPYHQENSRLMNILHVMGKRHDQAEELYAAHWDVSKPVKLYINGAEDKAIQDLLIAGIEKWNQVYQEEGVVPKGQKAFEPIVQSRKHDFDLRYPGITYVADRRISENNALGVGYAHADLQNGKILWGHVLVFGGLMESLVQMYSENDPGHGGSGSLAGMRIFPGDAKAMGIPSALGLPEGFENFNGNNRSVLQQQLNEHGREFLNSEMVRLASEHGGGKTGSPDMKKIEEQIQSLRKQMTAMSNPKFGNKVAADLMAEAQKMKRETEKRFAGRSFLEHLGMTQGKSNTESTLSMSAEDRTAISAIVRDTKDGGERVKRLRGYRMQASSAFPDKDLTAAQLRSAMAREGKNAARRPFREHFDGMMMKLLLHELGHMYGLGHQFKENIVPEEGTVPSAIQKSLAALANPEHEFTNLSSIMGYLSGRTWMALDSQTLMPGPQDRLVLRYLYKQEYTTYNKDADKFDYFKMPENGRVPDMTVTKQGKLPTGYFPQCNDVEASYSADPFCNRWDRGNTAEELVRFYFEWLTDDLVSDLYSFVGGHRSDADNSEWRLWARTFSIMGRVRLFYDEMRLRLSTDRELVPIWDRIRRDKAALYEFSASCMAKDESGVAHEALKELMFRHGRKSEGIRDLCRASKLALNEMKFLLTLPESDYSKIDTRERYIMSGYLVGDVSTDYRQMIGKWYQLSNLPMKIASLYALTSPYAFMWPGWANPFYTTEGRSPLYRTLYPGEYTRTISDMVESNMRFEGLEKTERNSLGHIILSSSWMLPRQNWWSSDPGLLPSDFNRVMQNQTEFQFTLAAVLITANSSQQDIRTKANHYKRFTGTMFDLMLQRSRTARDVYLLPEGTAMVRVNDMFLVPLTQMRFLDDTSAYIIAIKIDYDSPAGDKLTEQSVKAMLTEKHEQVTSTCVSAPNGTGLSEFFSTTETGQNNVEAGFEGFYIPAGIAEEVGTEKTIEFYNSIEKEFSKYEKAVASRMTGFRKDTPMRVVCDQSMRGVGQISAAAAMLNGFWLPITNLYIK